MEMQHNQQSIDKKRQCSSKIVIILIAVLVSAIVAGGGIYYWQQSIFKEKAEVLEKKIEELENQISQLLEISDKGAEGDEGGDFKYDSELGAYYGNVVVNGYVTLSERPEAFCEENCPIYTYVFFNILDTDNQFIDDYITGQKGNSFVGEMSIGLGCVDNNILWRWNDSNEFGMQKYTNSSKTSQAVLNSNKESPISINLERYLYTSGRGAPDCYSHFANVSLIE